MDRNHNPRRPSYNSSSSRSLSTKSRPTNYTSNHNNYNSSNNQNNPRNPTTSNSSYNRNHETPISISNQTKVGSPRIAMEHNHGEAKDCSNFQPIVGTCPFMCPEKERSQRERLRDLAIFERLHGNPSKSSSTLAVKKFCRTISSKDLQATDIRPLPLLEETLDYLMKFLESSDQPFEVIHDFIFDRTRSIRQDLSMQNIYHDQVIFMYEKMVRFHIISHYKLRRCEGDSTTISSIHYLNREQLTKCLASLFNLYHVNCTSDSIFSDEAEFRSLYVLLHLDSQSHSTGESLSVWFSRLPSFIMKSKKMYFARIVLRFYQMGNFWRFFRAVAAEATYLQSYIIEPYIYKVWARALECINSSGYKLHPYPIASLSKILMIKELDLEAFCNACGLETSKDDMANKVLPTKQTGFCHPKEGLRSPESSLLELFEN